MLLSSFIIASLACAALSFTLSARQIAHVTRHRGAVPPDFAGTISLEDHRKAADYTIARERLARIETGLELALTLAWALGGIGLLYGALSGLLPPSLGRGVAFLVGTAVVGTLLHLPLEAYKAFWLEQRFGFNRMTLRTFVLDRLQGWALGLAVSVPLLFAALWTMRTFTGLWWLWTWAALLVLMVAAPSIYVRLVAPWFNRFTPLADTALRARIEGLLDRSGFRSSGLFVMDASRRTAHGNAYFIGFGKAKRIVLFDTLLARSSAAEIEAVIAHELGHFKHRHIWFGLGQGALVLLVGLAAFGWLCGQPWLLTAFGIEARDPALGLFVCMMFAGVAGDLLGPVSHWVSRRHEFQADDYARRTVGAAPMISALTGLARDNASTLTPDPLYALAHYSHPPVPIRIRQLRRSDTGPSLPMVGAERHA